MNVNQLQISFFFRYDFFRKPIKFKLKFMHTFG